MKFEIGCPHFVRCSGCVINSCAQPPEIYEHAKRYFADTWQVDLGFTQGQITGYRSRAKLAVRAPDAIGLFEKASHNVLDIPHCKVHHPQINEAVRRLKQLSIPYYNETTHTGLLRYIQCVVERSTGRVQLTLVLNGNTPIKGLDPDPTFWHSIWYNYNDKPTNTIFGPRWEKIAGEDVVWEEIAGIKVAFGPSHFGQANLEMYEALIQDLQKHILPNANVVELFAGIGTIGMAVAEKSKRVELVELEAHAKKYFDLAKAKLPQEIEQKLTYSTAKAAHADGAEVCIVDPPRKGLGPELIKRICNTPTLKQLVYVSCEWKSLERDLSFLRSSYFENWHVKHAHSYLFFPGTNQIETLVILEKR
ncbi:MAG: class I SAM-dependent RNA methyltransferase [Verrucomicrobia bacterium]|nr:class I SAM-dependent RNA methyltransferase [Verrucomicrobiota bacterium]